MPSPSNPVAFELFGVGIRWYAIFILSGIAAAIWLIRWIAVRRGLDPDFPLDIAPWVVLIGIAGARLTYVLLRIDHFSRHPAEALNIRLGGLAIHGALLAGGLTLWWMCRRRGQSLLVWSDILVAGVALGQAIGRWGNWANQEAFGGPTTLPWGLEISPERRPPGFESFSTFHPTFLYESIFNLLNAALLTWIALNVGRGRDFPAGTGLAVYCIAYGVGRFAIESLRLDSLYVGPLPGAYWVSAVLVVAGLAILRWTSRREPSATAAAD